jgi:hypothetical protein
MATVQAMAVMTEWGDRAEVRSTAGGCRRRLHDGMKSSRDVRPRAPEVRAGQVPDGCPGRLPTRESRDLVPIRNRQFTGKKWSGSDGTRTRDLRRDSSRRVGSAGTIRSCARRRVDLMPNSDAQSWRRDRSVRLDTTNRPRRRAIHEVELGGLEPPTSWVRSRRSPN